VQTQITLLANARLVAGPSGSGLFNLAFEGRLRSAFILVWEEFIQLSEMLISAGHDFDLWYHLGLRTDRGPDDPWGSWSVNLKQLDDDVAAWLTHTAS
jgi:capsular polysaccharide biosynthesis protein